MLKLEQIKDRCIEVGDCWEWQGCLDHTAPVVRMPSEGGKSGKLVPVRRPLH
jgi:hypothetical protein